MIGESRFGLKRSESGDWAIALGYVALIYLTLSVVPTPLNYLRSNGLLKLTLHLVFISCGGLLFYELAHRKIFHFWRIALLAVILSAYHFLANTVSTPEEQIHFLEYGLVGIFFIRALRHRFYLTPKSYFFAMVLASLSGWVDELLQGTLSNRHYDRYDILLNVVSAFLGLSIFFLFHYKKISPPPVSFKNI